ncbi:MAG: thiol-disulfide isomerase [Blastocatellia bacterium]|nr:thiol-disulfide isomerase [Blastocatellia bacterium]
MNRSTRVLFLFALASLAGAGLFLISSTNTTEAKGSARTVTFNKDVAPIFFKSCAECHRPGEVAPFSALSYKDVRPWAKSIREKIVSKEMPPWHADPNHGEFMNDRRLTQAQIDTIVAWVDGGVKEGVAKDLPPAPKFPEGWAIGKPDETFSIAEQKIPAEGVVKYQYLTVPTNFKEDRWITAAEIRSTGRAAVHHVIVFIQDPANPGNGSTSGNLLAGVAPGEQPASFLPGTGKKIPAGSRLIFQMHYTPNGTATTDVTTLGLKYAKEPPQHAIQTRPVLNTSFRIPAGAANHEVKSSYTFNQDVRLTSLMPHMHLRGKDMEIKALLPDGTTRVLLSVPRYDFNWQTYYVPKTPLSLPKGTKVECTAHYDNSPANKFNPDPTKDVRWGDQTWEEMMIGWLSYYVDPAPQPKPDATK